MRLIDADKIDFGRVFVGASDFAKDTREAAQKLIDEQPTAYDMNKVVKMLKRRKKYLLAYSELQKKRQISIEEKARISEIDGIVELIKSAFIE